MNYYQLADMNLWQCRTDAKPMEYFCHNVIAKDLNQVINDQPKFALLGFACDLGVQNNYGRIGAKLAPGIIRQFLSRLTIPYLNQCYDCGDIVVDNNASLLEAQQLLAQNIAKLVRASITPIVFGGGHETAYGHYLGLQQAIDADIAILNFDAHFDLREVLANNEGTSGTPFRQIYNECQKHERNFNYYCIGIQPQANTLQLYEFAKLSKTQYIEAETVQKYPEQVLHLVSEIIAKHKYIYVTVCLDVFHYSYAPGVSAPQALGITPYVVIQALRQLRHSDKVVALDLVEFNPKFDIDNHTARLAASLLYNFYYA